MTYNRIPFRGEWQATAGANWPTNRRINFSHKTANSGLRAHLDRWHRAIYTQRATQYGWTNQLPSFVKEQAESAQANAANDSVMQVPYSAQGAVDRLVRFIVANDQVCDLFWLDRI
jgi:hypothetical protein